jgi:hypothetical protein
MTHRRHVAGEGYATILTWMSTLQNIRVWNRFSWLRQGFNFEILWTCSEPSFLWILPGEWLPVSQFYLESDCQCLNFDARSVFQEVVSANSLPVEPVLRCAMALMSASWRIFFVLPTGKAKLKSSNTITVTFSSAEFHRNSLNIFQYEMFGLANRHDRRIPG